jgi:uncharacterized membrane protein YccC
LTPPAWFDAALSRVLEWSSQGRQTVRVTVGALSAFALYEAFRLPQGFWAVFTVVIVMQGSIGGTVSASIDRMKGTLLGAVVGGCCASLAPRTPIGMGAGLAIAVGATAFFSAFRQSLKVAPVTAVIMLLSPAGAGLGPLQAALYRVIEIAVGGAIGVLASILIFPARSRQVVVARTVELLDLMADALASYAHDLQGAGALRVHDDVQMRIRTRLESIEAAMLDAEREQAIRFGAHGLSAALPRTLWRVRNDCVSVSRALGPLPDGAPPLVLAPIQALMTSQARLMRDCGLALKSGRFADRTDEAARLEALQAAMSQLRRAGSTHAVDLDAVARLFGLAFALESLHRNVQDLADRIDEAAQAQG